MTKKYRFIFQNKEYIKSGVDMANVGIPVHIHRAYYIEIVLPKKQNNQQNQKQPFLFYLKWLLLLFVLLNKSTVLFFVHYSFYNL